jgi:NTP pyrophosphatase (non-canonical NTP hydrolase)
MNIGKNLKDHQKLVEELLELATVVTQQLNKSSRDLTPEIIEEIGDVQWRLDRVKKYYNSDLIQEQIDFKRDKQKVKQENIAKAEAEKLSRIKRYRTQVPIYKDNYGKTSI